MYIQPYIKKKYSVMRFIKTMYENSNVINNYFYVSTKQVFVLLHIIS
jgi:hypothetical protein